MISLSLCPGRATTPGVATSAGSVSRMEVARSVPVTITCCAAVPSTRTCERIGRGLVFVSIARWTRATAFENSFWTVMFID